MNNQKFTITVADINTTSTGIPLLEPCTIGTSTPRHVYFINNCGKTIEINFIALKERDEFFNDATTFIGIPVPNGTTFSSRDILGEFNDKIIEFLLVAKAESGDATADLDIYCLDYI